MKELIYHHYLETPMSEAEENRAKNHIMRFYKTVPYNDMYNHIQNNRITVSLRFVQETYEKESLPYKRAIDLQTHEKNRLIKDMWEKGMEAEEIRTSLREKYQIRASVNTIKRLKPEHVSDNDDFYGI